MIGAHSNAGPGGVGIGLGNIFSSLIKSIASKARDQIFPADFRFVMTRVALLHFLLHFDTIQVILQKF